MNIDSALLNKKILIIDDSPEILEIIHLSLARKGAKVFTAENGEMGLRALYKHHPDLVVLDIAMPVMNGWETCRRIREITAVPVIMVTAFCEDDDIVQGLKLGAIDYVTKPFTMRVLRARIEAALRQSYTLAEHPKIKPHSYKDPYLAIDLNKRLITAAGTAVNLSKTEFTLLETLFLNANKALTSQEIIESVWGENYHDGINNLYVYISQLRHKLEKIPSAPEYILTEFGVGYRFRQKQQPAD